MKNSLLFLFVLVPFGAHGSVITFTKEFPGSTPAFTYVSLSDSGGLVYKEAPDDERPLKAQMEKKDVAPLFDLAAKLNYFNMKLESGLKVANTGKKVFRFDDGSGKTSECVFNYTTDAAGQQLLARFEDIAATERAFIDLERATRFDKLGVNDALAQIESLWLKKQLAAPDQFLPLLTRISSHESYMHLVRERASRLKDEFRSAGQTRDAAGVGAK